MTQAEWMRELDALPYLCFGNVYRFTEAQVRWHELHSKNKTVNTEGTVSQWDSERRTKFPVGTEPVKYSDLTAVILDGEDGYICVPGGVAVRKSDLDSAIAGCEDPQLHYSNNLPRISGRSDHGEFVLLGRV